jgi:hypothetical protein
MIVRFRYGTGPRVWRGKITGVSRNGEGPFEVVTFRIVEKGFTRGFKLHLVHRDDRAYMVDAVQAAEMWLNR